MTRLEAALEALAGEEPDEERPPSPGSSAGSSCSATGTSEAAPPLEVALELAEALASARGLRPGADHQVDPLLSLRNRLEEARILLEGALELALANDLHAAGVSGYEQPRGRTTSRATGTAMRGGLRPRSRARPGGGGSGLGGEAFSRAAQRLVMPAEWDAGLSRVEVELGGEACSSLDAPWWFVGWLTCARGNVAAGEEPGRLSTHENQRRPSGAPRLLFAEAHVHRAEGKPWEALAAAEPAFGLAYGLGIDVPGVKLALFEALEAALALGDTAKLEELLATIEALRPGDRPPLLEAHARRFRSKLDGGESRLPRRGRALPR